MSKTVLSIKTDTDIKRKAQKLAKEMGIPLSIIVNTHLRQFVRDQRIEVSAGPVPNAKTAKLLAQAMKDVREGKNIVSFKSAKDTDEYLLSL